MLDVNAMSEHLRASLADALYATGIGDAPKEGGWSGGTAGSGTFKAYLVVVFAGATPIFTPNIADQERDWKVNWTIRTKAASYSQLMRLGSAWRAHVDDYVKAETPFGAPPYRVLGLEWGPLGPANPDRSTTPATWSAQDSVAFLCSKA